MTLPGISQSMIVVSSAIWIAHAVDARFVFPIPKSELNISLIEKERATTPAESDLRQRLHVLSSVVHVTSRSPIHTNKAKVMNRTAPAATSPVCFFGFSLALMLTQWRPPYCRLKHTIESCDDFEELWGQLQASQGLLCERSELIGHAQRLVILGRTLLSHAPTWTYLVCPIGREPWR